MTARAKYLRIPDASWTRHQHYQNKAKRADYLPDWIKLYVKMLDHVEFNELPAGERYVYIGLLMLASRTHNLIPSKANWLANRLQLEEHEVKIAVKSLLRIGLVEQNPVRSSRDALDDAYARREETRVEEIREEDKELLPSAFKIPPLKDVSAA